MGDLAAGAEKGAGRGIPEKEETEEVTWAFLVTSPVLALGTVPWGIIRVCSLQAQKQTFTDRGREGVCWKDAE